MSPGASDGGLAHANSGAGQPCGAGRGLGGRREAGTAGPHPTPSAAAGKEESLSPGGAGASSCLTMGGIDELGEEPLCPLRLRPGLRAQGAQARARRPVTGSPGSGAHGGRLPAPDAGVRPRGNPSPGAVLGSARLQQPLWAGGSQGSGPSCLPGRPHGGSLSALSCCFGTFSFWQQVVAGVAILR